MTRYDENKLSHNDPFFGISQWQRDGEPSWFSSDEYLDDLFEQTKDLAQENFSENNSCASENDGR